MTENRAFASAIVVMGVSASGKTTVGEQLAQRLGVHFRDADEFHPAANVAKMSAGIPLTDKDREPWLDAIGVAIRDADPAGPVVVSCSALKRAYRDRIRRLAGRPVTFVHLTGPKAVLAARIGSRRGHFMPASLLDSQIATLEPPGPDERAITVSIEKPVDEVVEEVLGRLGGAGAPPR
jgi:carbohydrate kinase (thermoresistant glucokinase family)